MDVHLVAMPYADLKQPSAALGLLKAILAERGVSVRCHYASLLFAERIGLQDWNGVFAARPQACLGEWTFSHVAFPEHRPDPERFVAVLEERRWIRGRETREELLRVLARIREAAAAFVEEVAEVILSGEPRIVACSSTFAQHVSSLALLRLVRARAPRVVTMMGGANCEDVMGVTTHRSFPWVDYVVSGEADGVIADLVGRILGAGTSRTGAGERETAAACDALPAEELPAGILGPVHRLQDRPSNAGLGHPLPFLDLDALPLPDYDEYFETLAECSTLRQRVEPALPLETSRGCWWGRCTFCGLNGADRPFRSKSPRRVLEQLDALHRRYQVRRVQMMDNIFSNAYFETLLPELRRRGRPYRIFWDTRSNLSRRQVQLLRDAGVVWMQPGIESLHSEHLGLMNKGRQAWEHVQLLRFCRESGVRLMWFMLNGFPGERDRWFADMARLLPLLTHLQPPDVLSPLTFTRFSHFHSHPEEHGIALSAPNTYAEVYPLGQDDLDQLVHFLEDREFSRQRKMREGLALIADDSTGIGRFRHELALWIEAFWKGPRPVLTVERVATGLRIVDTRPAAVDAEHRLSGLGARIFEVCDDAPTLERLREAVDGSYRSEGQIAIEVEDLIEKRLLARVDDRLVSLATWHPVRPLTKAADSPLGVVR